MFDHVSFTDPLSSLFLRHLGWIAFNRDKERDCDGFWNGKAVAMELECSFPLMTGAPNFQND